MNHGAQDLIRVSTICFNVNLTDKITEKDLTANIRSLITKKLKIS